MPSKDCIGEWTPAQVKTFVLAILEERRNHIDERFRQIELSTNRADMLLAQYKIDANNYHVMFLPRDEYNAEHRATMTKIDTVQNTLEQRLSFMDKERNLIKDDVITLKSRSGYVSIALIISVASGIAAFVFNMFGYLTKIH